MAVSTEERWKEHNETGRRHFERAEFAEAEQQYIAALRQATLLGAVTLTELGQVAFSLRDFTQAESYFRRALTIREQALGTESVDLMQALNDLAAPYYLRGELEQAERLYRRALTIGEAQLGDLSPDLAVTLSNLARLHQRKADWRAAAPLLGRLLAIKQRSLGESHPHAISLMLAVANARSSLGEHEVAEELVRRVLALQERAQAGDSEMVRSLNALAKIYMASGKTQLGGEIADKAAQRQKRVGSVPRARNTRARLDRDTPDFSADTPPTPKPRSRQAASSLAPPTPESSSRMPSHTPDMRALTPDGAGTPAKPSTPQAPGLIKAYAQMIESAEDARRGKHRSIWSKIFGR
ncbi:MAG: tetratricopeptide repeat protein [Gemmatimonadaceae bacterium]|nr:tetratricopeptide repeat protein [Gemmatimonadaceae bacterium]